MEALVCPGLRDRRKDVDGWVEPGQPSYPLHKTINYALFAGLVEADGQLVAVDRGDVAVAELLVKHALAYDKACGRASRFGDQFAFYGQGGAAGWGVQYAGRSPLSRASFARSISPPRGEVTRGAA